MDFITALKLVVEGGKIARDIWEDSLAYVSVTNGMLTIKRGNKFHAWMISRDDLEAEDWRIWKSGEVS